MKKPLIVRLIAILSAICLLLSFASCSKKQEEGAPTGMKKASPDNCGYKLFVPSSWVIDTRETELLTAAHVSETNLSNISMTGYSNEDGISLKEYWEKYKSSVQAMFDKDSNGNPIFELVTDAETTLVDNKEAVRCVYKGTLGDVELEYLQVFCSSGSNVYIFTFTAFVSRFETDLSDVEAILKYIDFDE